MFPGYLYALLAILQVCSILHVLSRGSWLLTQKLCKFLGWSAGRERQSPWKNACKNSVRVAIYNNSMRLLLTHDCKYAPDLQCLPRTKETNEIQRHRQWIIPSGGSFPQSPRMQEYEYFTKCIWEKAQCPTSVRCKRQEEILQMAHVMNVVLQIHIPAESVANAGLLHSTPIHPQLEESPFLHFPSWFC